MHHETLFKSFNNTASNTGLTTTVTVTSDVNQIFDDAANLIVGGTTILLADIVSVTTLETPDKFLDLSDTSTVELFTGSEQIDAASVTSTADATIISIFIFI